MSEQKIEQFWRNATTEDAVHAMQGKEVAARYRKTDSDDWRIGFLCGAVNTGTVNFKWYCYDGYVDDFYRFCQIYDLPAWFLNKPDPGEGYRLLEKFPPEPKRPSDDYWSVLDKEWIPRVSPGNEQQKEVWYRRRIEGFKPAEPPKAAIKQRPFNNAADYSLCRTQWFREKTAKDDTYVRALKYTDEGIYFLSSCVEFLTWSSAAEKLIFCNGSYFGIEGP